MVILYTWIIHKCSIKEWSCLEYKSLSSLLYTYQLHWDIPPQIVGYISVQASGQCGLSITRRMPVCEWMCCIINRYVIYHQCKNTLCVDVNLLNWNTVTPGKGILSRMCVIPLASGWVSLWFVKDIFPWLCAIEGNYLPLCTHIQVQTGTSYLSSFVPLFHYIIAIS